MNTNNLHLFQLESGLSKASEITKNFFKRVPLFAITFKGDRIRFRNACNLTDYLECSIMSMYRNGNYARIETVNSVINVWQVPDLYSVPTENHEFFPRIKSFYKGFWFEIDDSDWGPVAYILTNRYSDGFVNGGLSWDFNENGFLDRKKDKFPRMGWDYHHFGDYNPKDPEWGGRKWSYLEIIEEIKDYIDNLR